MREGRAPMQEFLKKPARPDRSVLGEVMQAL